MYSNNSPPQHISETGETHLQAEDDEQRGGGPRCPQDCCYQAAEGPGRYQGIRSQGSQGEESSGGDGPDGATDSSVVKLNIRG